MALTVDQQNIVNTDLPIIQKDLGSGDYAGAFKTAIGSESAFGGSQSVGAAPTDPLIADLLSKQGLNQIDPRQAWTPDQVKAYYDAFSSSTGGLNPSGPTGTGFQGNLVGQNPYGLWGTAADTTGGVNAQAALDASLNPGKAPDVSNYLGARPNQNFFQKNWPYLLAAGGLAAGGAGLLGAFGGATAGTAAAAGGDAAALAGDTAALTAPIGASLADLSAAAALPDLSAALPADLLAGTAGGATAGGLTGDLASGLTVTADAATPGALIGPGTLAAAAAPGLLDTASPVLNPAQAGAAPGGSAGGTAQPLSFLNATNASDVTPLSSSVADQFGISPDISYGGSGIPGAADFSTPELDPTFATPDLADNTAITDVLNNAPVDANFANAAAPAGLASKAGNYLSNPLHLAQLGLLGVAGANALKQPKLPSAAQTIQGSATGAVTNANQIIQTGGAGTPLWATQKASIDATFDQEIQNATRAAQQAAQNSGMGGANSGIVQEQIATTVAQINVQRQAAYEQALQQNVSNAIAELSGGDQALAAIAQMQLEQSTQARNAAAQTAQLALQLGAIAQQNAGP